MARKMWGVLAAGVMGAAAIIGCGSEPRSAAVSEAGFRESRRVFEADMRARLQDLDMRLDMLEGGGLRLEPEARDRYLELGPVLEEKREAFARALAAVRDQQPATWPAYREKVNARWRELDAAFKELEAVAH